MKKGLIIIYILLLSLLIGCKQSNNIKIKDINIVQLPYKLEYNLNETLDLNGLIIELIYDNNTTKIIDDYEIEHSDLIIGENTITIKYQEFKTSFTINIINTDNNIQKLELLQYNDYLKTNENNFNINDYEYKFINVSYGVYRDTNMMIVYDELNYIKTNSFGYEVSVDENGFIVETNKNVSLVKNGFVISGHGTSTTLLKQLNIGDYIIFLDNIIFVYDKNNINNNINNNKSFIKFLEIIKKINLIKDISKYNQIVSLLNEQIPILNKLDFEFNIDIANEVYKKLEQIEYEINNDININTHKYSYVDTNYQYLDKLDIIDDNNILFSNYTDKLYYGGFRNTNTLVYYDKTNYISRNNYGYEISVDENNKIIDMNILVDLPENGYILSGHGKAADFIKANLKIGDKVEITSDTINFYRDLYNSSYNNIIEEYNFTIKKINEHIALSIPHDYEYINKLVEYVNILINTIYTNINNNNLQNNIHYQKSLIKYYLEIIYSQVIDYKINNTKAMWYYPFQNNTYDDTTLEGIKKTLDRFKEMGFNEIIIQTFKGNYSLYDSKYFYQDEEIKNYSYGEYGNDYLTCFINEAHQRGLIVNAFTQTFRCYEDGSKVLNENHYQIDINEEYSKGQVYYYDICNDFVQNTLTSWYVELVEKYDFDKIEYDIIRYSVSNLYKYLDNDDISNIQNLKDPGYTEYAINKFKEKHLITSDLKELILTNKEIRKKWLKFKQEELTNFITTTTTAIKQVNPNIIISAAVFAEEETAKKSYLQDYRHWLELEIIDQIEPMIYSDVNSYVEEYVNYYKDNFYIYDYRIGLGNITSLWDIIIQIELSSKYGFVLFRANEYLQDKYYELFKNNHHYQYPIDYNNDEEVKNAVKLDLIDKINNYYEIKNNENYDYLIELINNNNMLELEQAIKKLKDLDMSNYLLEIIKVIS